MKTIIMAIAMIACCSMQLQAQCPNAPRTGVHIIQHGDDLYKIANLYQVELQDIMTWNQLGYNQPLMLCQELIVRNNSTPESYNQSTETFTSRGLYTKQGGKKHRVSAGQSMAGLAELYGYSESRFREFNAMNKSHQPQPGDILLSSDCTCDRISYTDGLTDYAGLVTTNNKDPYSPPYTRTPPTTPTTNNNPPTTSSGSSDEATSMNSQEMEMVNEINLVRGNPSGYIQYVDAYVNEQRRTGGFPVDQSVVNELKSELRQLGSLSILSPSQCIYQAAKEHGIDQKPTGDVNHQGRDGSWPWDRVRKGCPNMQDGNENLVAGTPSIRTAVILLLIDEGIPTRGHRKTLLKPEWKYVGCYNVGTVGSFPHYWVQNFGY